MDKNPSLFLIADEIRATLSGLGQYKGGYQRDAADRASFLSLYPGIPVNYDRVKDNIEIHIEKPSLSIVGGMQPKYLPSLSGDDGLRDRFAISYVESQEDTVTPLVSSMHEQRAWHDLVIRLAKRREREVTRDLDPSTKRQFFYIREDFAKYTGFDQPEHVRGWAKKAMSFLLRLALLYAECRISTTTRNYVLPDPPTGPMDNPMQAIAEYRAECERIIEQAERAARDISTVSKDDLEAANAVAQFYLRTMIVLPLKEENLMVAPSQRTQDEAVEKFALWLRARPQHFATERDIQRSGPRVWRTPDELRNLTGRFERIYPDCVVIRTARGPAGKSITFWAPGFQPRHSTTDEVAS